MQVPRLIAIGDIHGCSSALAALLQQIAPQPADTLVTLGDYLDCGPDSRGVLQQLIELKRHSHLVALLGNHEEMFLGVRDGQFDLQAWKNLGGKQTLRSYGDSGQLDQIPAEHFRFLDLCQEYYETESHFFLHANYFPNRHVHEQDSTTRLWLSLKNSIPTPHFSGKTAIVGHTPQLDGQILDLGHLICLDTGCGYGGCLSAMDLANGQIWQVDESGDFVD